MGQLAVGIVGGIIGSFFGMPQLGFLAGSLVGGLLFPAKGASQQGPRIDNLQVTSSTYGQPINIVYGTVRCGGNIIWAKPLREVENTQKVGGKGGGSSAKSTTFTYNWTGMVQICEGPITGLLRIWADGKLVYDNTPNSGVTKRDSLNFRVYLGDEDQMPDPVYEDDKGAANVPAHRGSAYILFDDIPVADYGNRPPNWTFEVAVTPLSESGGVTAIIDNPDSIVGAVLSQPLMPDWKHEIFYKIRSTGDETGGIRVYSMATMQEIRSRSVEDDMLTNGDTFLSGINFGSACCDDVGYIYTATGTTTNNMPIAKIDGTSLQQVANVGVHGSGGDPWETPHTTSQLFIVKEFGATYQKRHLVCCTLSNLVQFIATESMQIEGFGLVDENLVSGCAGEELTGQAIAYLVGHYGAGVNTTLEYGVYKVDIVTQAGVLMNLANGTNPGITFDKLGTIAPQDVVPWWSYFGGFRTCFYDTHTQRLYILLEGGRLFTDKDVYLVKYNPETAEIEDRFAINQVTFAPSNTYNYNVSRMQSGIAAFVGNAISDTADVQRVNLVTGQSTFQENVDASNLGGYVYDSIRDRIVAAGTTLSDTGESHIIILTGRTAAGDTALSDVVADVCERIGLEPADYDVSELEDDVVQGYILNGQMTARAAIEPLALSYQFDGVESDFMLKFLKRGRASAMTITQDQLVTLDDKKGDIVRETRAQEVEMPERVSVVYLDRERDYQPNTMSAKRVTSPSPAMWSKNQVSKTVPVVMDADEAKRLAETLLYTSWIERVTQDFKGGTRFLALDPVDVVTITMDSGKTYVTRIMSADFGADFAAEFKSVNEIGTTYTSTVVADGGTGLIPQTIPGPTTSRTFILNAPLLRDIDTTGGTASRMYVAAGGWGTENWPGESVMRSADGVIFDIATQLTSEVTWGVAISTLGGTDFPFSTDEENTITVQMVAGADNMESVTQLQMLNGANAAILMNDTTGVLEVVGYRDVVQNDDGSFTLSGLLRGQRGTDVFVGSHTSSEIFILLTSDTLRSFIYGLSEVGLERYYKGVPYGTYVEDADLQTRTGTGADLLPYAPVSFTATENAGDIDLTWERRTRIGGGLVDEIGTVPLAEDSEAYEIDIYDGSDIVRTLESSTDSVTYLAADITTDFGSVPATLKIAVYQMSAQVGRGHGYVKTIPVG